MTAQEAGALWSGLMVLGMIFVAGLVEHSQAAVLLSIIGTALAFMGYQVRCLADEAGEVNGTKVQSLINLSVGFSFASWPCATTACLFLYLNQP